MAKYLKIIVESEKNMKEIMELSRKFAVNNFPKAAIYAWDTEATDDTYHASFPEPVIHKCGREVGKMNGKPLICGEDEYFCPECRSQ